MSVNSITGGSGAGLAGDNGIARNGDNAFALRNEFLQMMVAQVRNQDPLNPLDGTEYVSQLAQFSTVEGLEYLRMQEQQNSVLLNTMQVLQSAQLVGKQVTVPASTVNFTSDDTLAGRVAMPEGAEGVTLKVYDAAGNVVAEKSWAASSSDTTFEFDLSAGKYRLDVEAVGEDVVGRAATYLQREVERVSLAGDGGDIQLQFAGGGSMSLFNVVEFGNVGV